MPISPRATLAALSLAGVVGLGTLAVAQPQDDGVRRTTTQPAAAPRAIAPATIGTIDINVIFKDYQKFKDASEKLQAEAMAEQGKLAQLANQGKEAVEKLQRIKPGTPDYKQLTDEITNLKAKIDAKKEQLQQEFELRSSQVFATTLNEIQGVTKEVAEHYKMTYVLKVSREPITPTDRNSIMNQMAQALAYADSSTDITSVVLTVLNKRYQQSGGGGSSSGGSAAKPAAATAPAAAPKAK